MSTPVTPPELPALPTPEEFLAGGKNLCPLAYDAESLRGWVDQFGNKEIPQAAAQALARLKHELTQPDTITRHDAAHKELLAALKKATAEKSSAVSSIIAILRSPSPAVGSVKAIKPYETKATSDYLSLKPSFMGELTGWRIKALNGSLGTIADSIKALNAPMPSPTAPASTAATAEAHIHGPGCGHDLSFGSFRDLKASLTDADGNPIHPHTCGHEHAGFSRASLREALPKGKAAYWVWGGLGAAAAGGWGLNQLGKANHQTPATEQEKAKDSEARAADVAYTINHALSCLMVDVGLQPVVAALFGVHVGCNQPGHNHGPQPLTFGRFWHEAKHYFKGEVFGDVLAVPLTIGVQRIFPNVMEGARHVLEPAVGWAFRAGADHSAARWAKQHGLRTDAPETRAHADAAYEREIGHLPQALMWNMFAYPLGAFGQKAMGHGTSYREIFKSKLVGAAVSNGLLIGARILAPDTAQRWDSTAGHYVIRPISVQVGKVFGIDADTMAKAQPHTQSWEQRMQATALATPSQGRVL